jgi:TonB family protein
MAKKSPAKQDKLLEIKVMWGGIVLDVRHFTGEQAVTVGTHPEATFKMITALPGEQTFTLVSPGGAGGHVVNAERSMEMEIRRNGSTLDAHQLPSTGAVRAHALGIRDRCRVLIGQLAFVIQYITPTAGVKSKPLATADLSLAKWVVVFLVMALGLWTAILLTPPPETDFTHYIKNPSRFAGMITPSPAIAERKKFDIIKERKVIPVKVNEGNWKKSENRRKSENKNIPREVKEKRDREVALASGLLDLLKKKRPGDGAGDGPGGNLFQGSHMTNLDQELEGIQAPGDGDTGGVGALRPGGGRPGAGGGDPFATAKGDDYSHRFEDMGYDNIAIGPTTKNPIKVDRDPDGTKLLGDGLSMELVGDHMARRWSNFKYCYSRQLDRDPNMWGKVTVNFTIGKNGRVGEAQVITSSLNNVNVEECVLRTIRRIIFPRPQGGGEVIVTYPFLFTTTQ